MTSGKVTVLDNEVRKVVGVKPLEYWECIEAAERSPYATKIIGWIRDPVAGHRIGWREARLPGQPFKYFENERGIWRAHCCHQQFLLALGFIDCDPGTINWIEYRGALRTFDKDCVRRLETLRAKRWFADAERGYWKLLWQSYETLPQAVQPLIANAVMSKDSAAAIDAFNEAWEMA